MLSFGYRLAACVSSTALLTLSLTGAAQADGYFERIETFPVYATLAAGVDPATETSAEIIAASKDGRTFIFTDSPGDALVFVNAINPGALAPAGRVDLGGEPTSVSVAAGKALTGVNTSESFVAPSGHLAVVDIATQTIDMTCDVGGQPDSVSVSPDGSYVAIAIENERDEDLNDGVIPQLPAGHLSVFALDGSGVPTNCDAVTRIDMTGLASVAGTDPEPEFVAINDDNLAVVTMQENNHLAIVDLAMGKVVADFTAGTASVGAIPTAKARATDGTGSIQDVPREPDAVAWIDNERFVTADEGDYEGGSRGFTIFNKSGDVLYESGALMEHLGISHGHYPAKRAHKKGTEPEGVTVGTFGGETLIFVNSERGNFVAVFKDTGAAPEFLQFLPTTVAPEGLLALPARDLFVVAAEKDEAEENVRSNVNVYRFGAASAKYPTITSTEDPATGAPIGWGALSGAVGHASDANTIFAVSDSFYDAARIFTIDVSTMPATITSYVDLKRGAEKRYDLEGISLRTGGGFWLSSEGHPKKEMKHLLLGVAADGTVEAEIQLPEALVAQAKRFSLEGVAEFTMNGKTMVAVAVQREWKDDPKGHAKIALYDVEAGSWSFVHYPLNAPMSPAGGWVGLSEITSLGGLDFAVVERDNKGGPDAAIKQVTRISLEGVTPVALGGDLPVLSKTLVMDLLPMMHANNGWTPDKVESLAVTADGRLFAITDNDGVDDATGETQFLPLGSIDRLMY